MRNTSNVPVHLRARYKLNNTGLLLQYKNAAQVQATGRDYAESMRRIWTSVFYPIE